MYLIFGISKKKISITKTKNYQRVEQIHNGKHLWHAANLVLYDQFRHKMGFSFTLHESCGNAKALMPAYQEISRFCTGSGLIHSNREPSTKVSSEVSCYCAKHKCKKWKCIVINRIPWFLQCYYCTGIYTASWNEFSTCHRPFAFICIGSIFSAIFIAIPIISHHLRH